MKYSTHTFLAVLFALAVFCSCNTDNDITPEAEMHSAIMHLNASRVEYDGAATRAAGQWAEGDSIFLLFSTTAGSAHGVAYYREATQDWQVNYYGIINHDTPSLVTVYYFEHPSQISMSDVTLDPTTATYYDSSGTYTLSGKNLTVTTTLSPLFGRIRFKGKVGQLFSLSGLSTAKNYAATTATMLMDTTSFVTTIQSDGYSPYIYGCFKDEESPTFVIQDGNFQYTALCNNMMSKGKSGWMDLPTETSHNGWSIEKYYTKNIILSSSSSYPWERYSGKGNNCLRSTNYQISNSTSSSTLTITHSHSFTLSFNYQVSSESTYDKLTIQVDGTTVVNAISGTQTSSISKNLSAGTHTITMSYSKDGTTNKNDDRGYIYNIAINGTCISNSDIQ